MEVIVILILFVSVLTLVFGLKNQLNHTQNFSRNDELRLQQLERSLCLQDSTQRDRQLARIERKLDLILNYLEIEDIAAEDNPIASHREFVDIILESVPPEYKISVIKIIRMLTGDGLKEAKNKVESTPCIIQSRVPLAEAEVTQRQLEQAGGRVILR